MLEKISVELMSLYSSEKVRKVSVKCKARFGFEVVSILEDQKC